MAFREPIAWGETDTVQVNTQKTTTYICNTINNNNNNNKRLQLVTTSFHEGHEQVEKAKGCGRCYGLDLPQAREGLPENVPLT